MKTKLFFFISFLFFVFSFLHYYSSKKDFKNQTEIAGLNSRQPKRKKDSSKTKIKDSKKRIKNTPKPLHNPHPTHSETAEDSIATKPEIKTYRFGLDFEKDFFSNHDSFNCCEEEEEEGTFFEDKLKHEGKVVFYIATTEKEKQLFYLLAPNDYGIITHIQTFVEPKVDYFHQGQPIVADGNLMFLPPEPFKDRISLLLKKIKKESLICLNIVLKAFPDKLVDNITNSGAYIPVGIYCRAKIKHKMRSFKLTHGLLLSGD